MNWVWFTLGWTGQALFFSRFVVQWWASERADTSVAPRSFWWLSLFGTLLVGGYTFQRGEPVLLPVFAINLAIYGRNLLLTTAGRSKVRVGPRAAALLGLAAAGVLWASGAFEPRTDLADSAAWLQVGAVGAAVWASRFLLQWWSSERAGESRFPPSFWWVSLAGNGLLLVYALHLRDPLYVVGFAIGPFVQVRNLVLIYRPKGELRPAAAACGPASAANASAANVTAAAVRRSSERSVVGAGHAGAVGRR